MQLPVGFFTLAVVLSTGAMADLSHQEKANHKRFVVARSPLAGIAPVAGLLGAPAAAEQPGGPITIDSDGNVYQRDPLGALPLAGGLPAGKEGGLTNSLPVAVNPGHLLTGRAPLVGVPVPGVSGLGGLTSGLAPVKNLAPAPLGSRDSVSERALLAGILPGGQEGGLNGLPVSISPGHLLTGRAPLVGVPLPGVPSVGGLTSMLAPVKDAAPLPLGNRGELAGPSGSLGGLTEKLGLNQEGKTGSLVPLSLVGARDSTAASSTAQLAKTVQGTTAKLGAARNQLKSVFGGAKPVSEKVAIFTFKAITDDVRKVTVQLSAVKVSPRSNTAADTVAARELTLPGLVGDLLSTVDGLLLQLEGPLKDILEGVLGAVGDALKPYAGSLLQAVNGLLLVVEDIVQTLGFQLSPLLQPILDLLSNLADALGLELVN
ncbi:unnamed protein product [Tilletia laevis]|uniref:Uncharacterized protein n=2 Tax=Tilletia TaxID=13289 RepID=A0A177URJ9_9BASI|nr:hypothetical protein CF336_g2115 [Tilletia laevis]KAE8263146.1 hypothetical protein A4X03_0g1898 [Tilletia caries]KAE8206947.1 hypothetical protein CF335_g1503 [Tilletia laevis]CAD6891011.1 unnamed protein product [Tilletia caries]CAD6896131.1 unnamed protein product [Tilletia laevis]